MFDHTKYRTEFTTTRKAQVTNLKSQHFSIACFMLHQTWNLFLSEFLVLFFLFYKASDRFSQARHILAEFKRNQYFSHCTHVSLPPTTGEGEVIYNSCLNFILINVVLIMCYCYLIALIMCYCYLIALIMCYCYLIALIMCYCYQIALIMCYCYLIALIMCYCYLIALIMCYCYLIALIMCYCYLIALIMCYCYLIALIMCYCYLIALIMCYCYLIV